jgi:hypothetical protein
MLAMPALLFGLSPTIWQDVMTGTSTVATPEAGFWKHGRRSLSTLACPWPECLSDVPGDHTK